MFPLGTAGLILKWIVSPPFYKTVLSFGIYLRSSARRVAQASDLAGITNTVGCPVLRVLGEEPALSGVEGAGTTNACATGFAQNEQDLRRQHRHPPLQKTQGWGTLSGHDAHKSR